MEDDFDEEFSKYPRPKNARDTGAVSSREVASSNFRFEDITQETGILDIVFQVYPTTETPQQKDRHETRFKDYSLILRRIVPKRQGDRDPVLQLEIQSTSLREAFCKLATGLVNINLRRSPIIIHEPYVEVYHCQNQIEEAVKVADDAMKIELRLLQTFQRDYMHESIKDFESLEADNLISFDCLQHLFVPGSVIVLPNGFISDSLQPYWAAVLVQCQVIKNKNDKEWEINLVYTNFDGTSFGAVFTKLRFPAFKDIKKIINLPAYPIKYHPRSESLLQELEDRGRKYHSLCMDPKLRRQDVSTGSHWHYDGPFWEVNKKTNETQRDMSYAQREPKKSRGICSETTPSLETYCNPPSSQCASRVVIDLPGFVEENPSFRDYVRHDISGPSIVLSSSETETHSESHISRLQFITLPSFIPAFSLAKRSWGFVDVNSIDKIQWDMSAYENLQMDRNQKESVKRLVSTHRTSGSGFDDFISGKGKGLVFLLHGPPGSGKTMTAETIAESLHSPLYYTSGGELSIDKDRIEEQLQLIFQRIHRWGAILLLDEADTFMAKRGEDSLERNALVSILLRMLEYQSGILFLTTNRLSDFDTAFYSRIHVCIEFESPDAQRRMYIWSKIAGQLPAHEITPSEFERLGSLPLDGRRIKNVIKVASLLMQSKGDGAPLSFDDVKAALQISAGDPSEVEVQRKIEELCI